MKAAGARIARAVKMQPLMLWCCMAVAWGALWAFAPSAAFPDHHQAKYTPIKAVSDWIKGLQYTDPAYPSLGAIRVHHSPGYIAPNGDAYYRVVPYSASLAVAGLLRAPCPGRLSVAEQWIDWYLSHLEPSGTPPGVVV